MRFLIVSVLIVLFSSIDSVPIGVVSPKSSLYSYNNGILEGGYNIAKTNNVASTGKSGSAIALTTDYSESIGFNKNTKTGAGNTQTAGTTGINTAIQLPVVDQDLINKYAKKKPAAAV